MLLFDEGAAQRHHHQHAEDAPGNREERDLQVVEVRRSVRDQEDERRNREHDARGERLAGRADRLHDVVFENRRCAEPLEDRDRQHRDRDRRADGEAGPQAEIDRRCPEQQAEERAEDDRAERELGRRLRRGHVRRELGIGHGRILLQDLRPSDAPDHTRSATIDRVL